jgi:hypothetical protein
MPIIRLTNSHARQICANCGTVRELQVNDLKVGFQHPRAAAIVDAEVIHLPKCTGCNSYETLARVVDDYPVSKRNTFGFLHSTLVNKLHDELHTKNKHASQAVKDKIDAEPPEKKAKRKAEHSDNEIPLPGYLAEIRKP